MAEEAKEYDAIVIGSGLAGSMAAMELCEQGVNTLVLEAGPKAPEQLFSQKGEKKFSLSILLRFLALFTRMYRLAFASYLSVAMLDVLRSMRSPYSTAPGKPFSWTRVRVVNGRGLLWGRLALRLTESELQATGRDGYVEKWPLTVDDLQQWYEKVERVMNVVGPMEVHDQNRSLLAAESRESGPVAEWVRQRLEPQFSVYGMRRAEYTPSALSPMLESAMATGRMTLRENAVVTRLLLSDDGKCALGVEIVDRETKHRTTVQGRMVLLAASSLETVRILLNTPHTGHSQGVGNSSGLLGRGVMDSVHTQVIARIPSLSEFAGTGEWDPTDMEIFAKAGFYIPPFVSPGPEKGFVGGYQIEGTAFPKFVYMAASGEMMPRDENSVTLHPSRKDKWGVPILHISVAWSDNEKKMIQHQKEAVGKIIERLGGKELRPLPFVPGRMPRTPIPGTGIHEVGGARMGTSPEASVVNTNGQLWDVPNVFVCDGAVMPSIGHQNTTLTIMALAARSASNAAVILKRGEL